MNQPSGIR